MHIKTEHAVGLGITTGLMFVSGVAFGAHYFTAAETLLACLVSVILGFMPVATLFREEAELDDAPTASAQKSKP